MTIAARRATGTGTLTAHVIGRSRLDKMGAPRRGILYAPGGGGTEQSWEGGTQTNPNTANTLLRRLTDGFPYDNRFITFPTNWEWGNDTTLTRMTDAWTYAKANYQFATDRVHLIGSSLGGLCALNWAIRNRARVASVSLVIPCVDPQDVEDNGLVTPYSLPEPHTAYGGSRPPDDHTPARRAAGFRGLPILIAYSNNDSVCRPQTIQAFAEEAGAMAINLGDQTGFVGIPGHNALNLNPDVFARFIAEHD